MSLAQLYTAIGGDVITAARWNNEFGNIYTNGTDVSFPLTKAVSLAGFTLTLDSAGVTTLSSSATLGVLFNPGTKAGTPGTNGSIWTTSASTFNDSNTGASGIAALWTGTTLRAPTLTASNALVTTTDAATLYIENGPTAGANETITNKWAIQTGGKVKVGDDLTVIGDVSIAKTDSARTNTVDPVLTVSSVTTGSPAVSIGTGIKIQAESADESPSDFGQLEFVASDVTAGSEDTFFQVLLRVAGAALTAAYKFVATSAFKAIFTHANTANRTYTLPDVSLTLGTGVEYIGPTSVGAGSTRSHQGDVTISSNQGLTGVHFYTNFTLNAGVTLTVSAATQNVVIFAVNTITINGTITGNGGGSAGGTGGVGGGANPTAGATGYAQPGGGGGAGLDVGHQNGAAGGSIYMNLILMMDGGAGGSGAGAAGTAGTSMTGSSFMFTDPYIMMGGAGGGGGGGRTGKTGGNGGAGGASICLIAPNIILGAASVFQTAGNAGTVVDGDCGGGGGGAGGNIFMYCSSYTDNGATFTQTGGAGGNAATGGDGGAGADGVRQINIY